jgi:hypothetical protein
MTPSTKIVCPSCAKALIFRGPSPEGKVFKCPGCATTFRVPSSTHPDDDEDEGASPPTRPTAPAESISDKPDRLPARPSWEEDDETLPQERQERSQRRRKPKRKKSGSVLLWGLLGGGCLCLLLCLGGGGAVAYLIWGHSPSWKEFSPPDGRFTATFPGTPKLQTKQAMGQTIQMYILELSWGQFAYSVAYNDLGVDAEAMGGKAVLEGAARGLGGNIKSQKDLRLQGHPGKEVVVEMQQGGITMVLTNRIYVVKNRMYQVVVAGVKGKEPPASFPRFLDSFKLKD